MPSEILGRDLTEVTVQLLKENWPKTNQKLLALAVELDCNPETLRAIRARRTRAPSSVLCQRIYEHCTGEALLSV